MIIEYDEIMLNKLLDKYEKSKSFIGTNKTNQSFSIRVGNLFPEYKDDANYQVFESINEAVDILVRQSIVNAKANTARVYDRINLKLENLNLAYEYLTRTPKKDINEAVLKLIRRYKEKNSILEHYYKAQYERINSNKSIQFFNGNLDELENIIKAVDELLKVETETFVRDFSVRVFKDSKVFEAIAPKVISLMFEFGNFPEKDQVLGNLNIIKNPTYINFKGAGRIRIREQVIDLSRFKSDIGISSTMLSDIDHIQVIGKGVIAIENLTSFHTFDSKDMLAIYLGGYHNTVRREFIKKLAEQNPNTMFYHFGDIDAGGFYILDHLKTQTKVDFKPFKMDIETLRLYSQYTKPLTENDKKRLSKLASGPYGLVVKYMIENNCKLEQEAINIRN